MSGNTDTAALCLESTLIQKQSLEQWVLKVALVMAFNSLQRGQSARQKHSLLVLPCKNSYFLVLFLCCRKKKSNSEPLWEQRCQKLESDTVFTLFVELQ